MDEPRWISEREVSKITGVAVQTLRNDRWRGIGFPYYKVNAAVKYRLDEVLKAMEAHRVETRKAS